MNERIKKLAQAALLDNSAPPTVPETCENREELSDPMKVAEGVRRFMLKQPIDVRVDEVLADRYRVTLCDYPVDYYRRIAHDNLNAYWNIHGRTVNADQSTPSDLFYWGWTHVSLDYGYILQNGLQAYLKRIEAAKLKFAGNIEKTRNLDAMEYALHTMQMRSNLVSVATAKAAESIADPAQKQRVEALADTLRHTPMFPARSFAEAVQCVWTMFLIAPDSLGRIDQYLYPFYKADMESGAMDRETALELLEELFVRVHESQVENRLQPHSGHNHLVVGGTLQDGSDGFNELSELILDAIVELPTFRPQASFRYTKNTSPAVMRKITEYNRKNPIIVFVNDEPRIEGMVRAGIRREDAIEYTVLGCNEWAICGKSKLDLAHTNLLHCLKLLCFDHREEALTAATFEEFYALLAKYLRADVESIVEEYPHYRAAEGKDCNVMTSALMDDCIEKGDLFTRKGARYYGITFSFNSIPNLTDCLSVIKDFVYERKELTLAELLTALDDNWAGHEELRLRILRNAHFFGNDDAYADSLAQRIVGTLDDIRSTLRCDEANLFIMGNFVGATHPNIRLAQTLPATPDGRYSGEPLTMGVSQSGGKDKHSLTALLKSIACLDYSKFCGCIVSNIKLDPALADTPEKLDKLSMLFHTFLKLGGMQLQINYITNADLLAAQQTPDAYENLMVRVTGYSGYFTKFNKDLQDDIIRRTELEG